MSLRQILEELINLRRQKYENPTAEFIASSAMFYVKKQNFKQSYSEVLSLVNQLLLTLPSSASDRTGSLAALKTPPCNKYLLPDGYCVRYAVNPNLQPTFMNLKGVVVHSLIQKNNPSGKVYLRFDDTSPDNKPPTLAGYRSYKRIMQLFEIDCEIDYASSHLAEYYEAGRTLLKNRKGYLLAGKTVSYCLDTYQQFLNGKTPHVFIVDGPRKWVGLRKCNKPHPLQPTFKIWPTLCFQSPIDDIRLGITHIFRGIDLREGETIQKALLRDLGYNDYPICTYWGRHKLEGVTVSSSKLAKSKKCYKDPLYPTVSNLLHFKVGLKAITEFWKEVGISPASSTVNLGLLKKHCEPVKPDLVLTPGTQKVFFSIEHLTGVLNFHYCLKAEYKALKNGSVFALGNILFRREKGRNVKLLALKSRI